MKKVKISDSNSSDSSRRKSKKKNIKIPSLQCNGLVVLVSHILRYSGFDIINILGEKPTLRFFAEVNREPFEEKLKGDCPFWLITDEYCVNLRSSRSLPPQSTTHVATVGRFRGYAKAVAPKSAESTIKVGFDVPSSEALLDKVNGIRMQGEIPIFEITCNITAFRIGLTSSEWFRQDNVPVMKYLPNGELTRYIFLTTEEVEELMEKLKYIDLLRLEIPVPKTQTPSNETLRRCVNELKTAHEELIKGNYREALSICRNILMNHLLPSGDGERKLRSELRDAVIDGVPKDATEKYRLILGGIEATLRENLKHIHKFIKEDTGELLSAPLREDAEYVFTMLSTTIRYLSKLTMLKNL